MTDARYANRSEKLLIFSPVPADSTRGNQMTAFRWAQFFRDLGHETTVVDPDGFRSVDIAEFDVLIALHAGRSWEVIDECSRVSPNTRIFVVLTGTDLHGDLSSQGKRADRVNENLDVAERVILLEPEGLELLRPEIQQKSRVIFQSAFPVVDPPKKSQTEFVVTVIGHLRSVKDPFLTLESLRFLPPDSKIMVIHLGEGLDDEMKSRATRETEENSRYSWLGPVSHERAQRRLAASQLTVISSKFEGAPNVISEAVVNGVPILATRIHASIGLLGADYSGLFPVGDARALGELLARAESDGRFYRQLESEVKSKKSYFEPSTEKAALKKLIGKDS